MAGDADIAALGSVLGDERRVRILEALGDGRALPAGGLAREAGVAASTASEHLKRLCDVALISVEQQGRHRYFRLASPQVAVLLETLAQLAPVAPVRTLAEGTRADAIRAARTCYDHLAGRLGVEIMAGLIRRKVLTSSESGEVDYGLTDRGAAFLRDFGLDLDTIASGRRPPVRYCLDWSEKRHHLAGALGAALADRVFELGWIRRAERGRAVHLTRAGVEGFQTTFGIDWL